MTGKLRILAFAALAGSFLACERDELLDVDPEEAPGFAVPTFETLLSPEDVDQWIDSVFGGFSSAWTSTFMLAEDGSPDLTSRALLLFNAPIQDSVFFIDTVSAALSFDSLRLIVGLDTARSRLSSAGTTLQLRSLDQEWDPPSADWDFAIDSPGVAVPWTSGPGGSLGEVLSEVVLTEEPDSIVFDLTAYSDSLLLSWNDTTQVNTGLAMVVADSGRLVLGLPRLQYNVIPEVNPDTAVQVQCPSLTSVVRCIPAATYIFDSSGQPPPAGVLRIGGVSGWRSFTRLFLPDSVLVEGSTQEFLLRGATINKAEFIITSLAAPAQSFGAEAGYDASAFELADDYTVLGAKTPVGGLIVGSLFNIQPDSLEAGSSSSIDLTAQIQRWADIPFDSIVPPITFVIRPFPEGTTFGFWDFGAEDGDPAFVPVLRIIFTPKLELPFP